MRNERDLFGKDVDKLTPEELQGRVANRFRQCREYPRSRLVQELAEEDLRQLARGAQKRLRSE